MEPDAHQPPRVPGSGLGPWFPGPRARQHLGQRPGRTAPGCAAHAPQGPRGLGNGGTGVHSPPPPPLLPPTAASISFQGTQSPSHPRNSPVSGSPAPVAKEAGDTPAARGRASRAGAGPGPLLAQEACAPRAPWAVQLPPRPAGELGPASARAATKASGPDRGAGARGQPRGGGARTHHVDFGDHVDAGDVNVHPHADRGSCGERMTRR